VKRRVRRDLALLLGGATVSTIGSSVTLIAVLLHVRPLGPLWVALVLAASLLPFVVLSPVSGLLADRLPNRQLLATTLSLEAVAILAVTWFGLGEGQEVVLVVGLVLAGCAAAITNPTVSALIPAISGEAGATRAYGYAASLNQGGLLAGAALAGVLVHTLGTRGALLVDAATFIVMGAAVLLLRTQRQVGVATTREGTRPRRGWPRQETWSGFTLLARDTLLRIVIPGLAVLILVSIVVNIAEVFFLVEDLGVNPIGYGLITACWPLAGVAGGWVAGRLTNDRALVVGLGVGGLAMGIAFVLAGAVATVPGVALAWCLAGAANAVQLVCIQSLVRSRVSDAHRGRAFAAMQAVLQSANVVGLIVSAPVVAILGARTSMLATGVATFAVAATTFGLASYALRRSAREQLVAESTPAPRSPVVQVPAQAEVTSRSNETAARRSFE